MLDHGLIIASTGMIRHDKNSRIKLFNTLKRAKYGYIYYQINAGFSTPLIIYPQNYEKLHFQEKNKYGAENRCRTDSIISYFLPRRADYRFTAFPASRRFLKSSLRRKRPRFRRRSRRRRSGRRRRHRRDRALREYHPAEGRCEGIKARHHIKSDPRDGLPSRGPLVLRLKTRDGLSALICRTGTVIRHTDREATPVSRYVLR